MNVNPGAKRKGAAFFIFMLIMLLLFIIVAIFWNIYVYGGG